MLPKMVLMQNCYDAIEAIEYLNTNTVDLIFLDLNMPKLKGFEFLKTLSHPPKVIVTTAYKEYALEGYELNIIDYLLKPFSFERFLKAVNKAFNDSSKASVVIPPHPSNHVEQVKRIFLRSNKKHIQVILDDVLYIEAKGNYTKIVLKEESITIREKITALMELLPDDNFIRVHRSFVVASRHIKSIEGNQIHIASAIIPIGKLYKHKINNILN
ncbi:MAG: LytTR family DNA-binding domain-containing protein [Chitinophagales bacterium]|nr:LytTR family DNA-binding domain-containing protein [Chitinophagales bacterium]